MAGLGVLLAAPATDVHWEHHPAHFWLVLSGALTSAVLAYATGDGARRRSRRAPVPRRARLPRRGRLPRPARARDARASCSSSQRRASSSPPRSGCSSPALFAACRRRGPSRPDGPAIVGRAPLCAAALIALMRVWAGLSLAASAPLDDATPPESGSAPLTVARRGRRRPLRPRRRALRRPLHTPARADPARRRRARSSCSPRRWSRSRFARNWHASWWEWHVLMLTAFALDRAGRAAPGAAERFSDLYLDETTRGHARRHRRLRRPLGLHVVLRGPRPARGLGDAQRLLRARRSPRVRAHGGEIDRLVGDAIMATFNTRGDQPDHAERASRAALDLLRATERPRRPTRTGRASASGSTAARRWSASSARARARATPSSATP